MNRWLLNRLTLIAICVFVLFTSGCMSNGTKIDPDKVAHIQKGITTRTEVEANVGLPTAIALNPDGGRTATYMYIESQTTAATYIPYAGPFVGGQDARRQTLQVTYDSNGIVRDFEFQDASAESRGGLADTHTEWKATTTQPAK